MGQMIFTSGRWLWLLGFFLEKHTHVTMDLGFCSVCNVMMIHSNCWGLCRAVYLLIVTTHWKRFTNMILRRRIRQVKCKVKLSKRHTVEFDPTHLSPIGSCYRGSGRRSWLFSWAKCVGSYNRCMKTGPIINA